MTASEAMFLFDPALRPTNGVRAGQGRWLSNDHTGAELQSLLAALAFDHITPDTDPSNIKKQKKQLIPPSRVLADSADMRSWARRRRRHGAPSIQQPASPAHKRSNLMLGTLDPEGNVEVVFYDAAEFGDGENENEFRDSSPSSNKYSEEPDSNDENQLSPCCLIRGGEHKAPVVSFDCSSSSQESTTFVKKEPLPQWKRQPPLPPPTPPAELPLRFLRAGKGDATEGWRRYKATLAWRKEKRIDFILREPSPKFDIIKKHYLHYNHLRGKNNEPCFYEIPAKTDLKALRKAGITVDDLLRHYAMVVEYQWQMVEPDDFARSLYVIDLEGIRFGDFVGDVMDFVKKASAFCNQHYPERAGTVYVINVPSWFKMIWGIVKPWVDEVTLDKIKILRGKDEVRRVMQERIALDNLPPEYGGESMPLGQAPEEKLFAELIAHNNALAACHGDEDRMNAVCSGAGGNNPCKFCNFVIPRSY